MSKKLWGVLLLCIFSTIATIALAEEPKTNPEELGRALAGVWEKFAVVLWDRFDPTSNTLTLGNASERERKEIITTIPLDAARIVTSEYLNPCCDRILLNDGKVTIVTARGANGYNHWKVRIERYKRERENWLATKTLPEPQEAVTYCGPFIGLKAVDPLGGNVPAYWEFQLGYEHGAKKVAIPRDRIDIELRFDESLAGTIAIYGEGMNAHALITYSFESRWAVEVWRNRLAWDGSDDRED